MNTVKLIVGLLALLFIVFSVMVIGIAQGDSANVSGLRTVGQILTAIWVVILVGVGIGLARWLPGRIAQLREMRRVGRSVKATLDARAAMSPLVGEFDALFHRYLFEAADQYLAAGQQPPPDLGASAVNRASAELMQKHGLTTAQMAAIVEAYVRSQPPQS